MPTAAAAPAIFYVATHSHAEELGADRVEA